MAADEIIEKTVIFEELDHAIAESTPTTTLAPGWGSFAPPQGVYVMCVSECDHMLPYMVINTPEFGIPLVIELP